MFSEAKYEGDHFTVGEELLMGVSDLEERARVVEKSVNEGYFTLDQSLSLYKVSEIEYLAYVLLKNKDKLEKVTKQLQALGALSIIVQVFHEASSQFDPKVKTAMHQFERITKDPAFAKLKIKV